MVTCHAEQHIASRGNVRHEAVSKYQQDVQKQRTVQSKPQAKAIKPTAQGTKQMNKKNWKCKASKLAKSAACFAIAAIVSNVDLSGAL
ncbi:hypothetical protein AXG89_20820 [Burkholderia sp. PAMC 26561]|nr:hypothetical protein AXG89_20820 [Burkholderia sp. PAMC 26561]